MQSRRRINQDDMLQAAIEAVKASGEASTKQIERALGIGYARAGRMLDDMEERGIVGPYQGSKPRKILAGGF